MERKKTTGLRGVPKDLPRQKPTVKTTGPKGVAGMAKLMSQGMAPVAAKNLMRKARELKPSGRINMDDLFNADKYKMKMPKRAPMQKGPLGPLRPIKERSKISRLVRTNARRPKR